MKHRLSQPFNTTITFFMAVLGFLILLCGDAPLLAQEYIGDEEPTPSSVDQMVTPMEKSFKEKYWRPGIFPWLKES